MIMTERHFGEDKDKLAQAQLGLPEDWTIFYAAVDVDVRTLSFEEEFGDAGCVSVREVDDWLEESTHHVTLPPGLMLVGLVQMNNEKSEKKFAIINTNTVKE